MYVMIAVVFIVFLIFILLIAGNYKKELEYDRVRENSPGRPNVSGGIPETTQDTTYYINR